MSDDKNYDYGDDVAPQPTLEVFARLQSLAQEQADAEAALALAELEVEKARNRVAKVSETDIPELMESLGLKDFTTMTGFKIEVGEKVRCGITKDKSSKAMEWLESHKHGKMIKRVLKHEFQKGDAEKVEQAVEALKKIGLTDAEISASIHSSTLLAWVNEMLREGKEFPQDLFGVHKQRYSKITR